MVNLRQALWTVLLVCACVSSLHAHRVAILSDPGQSDMEALLLSSLSSSPDVKIIERTEIDAIVHEKRMEGFSADSSHLSELGKMLGADALVVLEDHGENLICKIIAVGPALIIDEQAFRSPVKNIPGWVKVTEPRILATIGRLPSQPASSHLLSVLGIRNTVRTPEAKQRESECAALIEHALSSLDGVFVLERARLKESDWEKQLSESASTPYWASAWIVDGALSGSDGAWTLDTRLQQRSGRKSQTFRVQATDLNILAQAVADAVAQTLRTTRSEQWPLKDEAALYQQEAEWAYQWKDYARSDRAASASWALGNHSDSLSLLRAKNCIDQTSWEGALSVNVMFSKEPPPGMLEKIVEGFSYIRHLSQPEKGSPGKLPAHDDRNLQDGQQGSPSLLLSGAAPLPRRGRHSSPDQERDPQAPPIHRCREQRDRFRSHARRYRYLPAGIPSRFCSALWPICSALVR